MVDHSGPLLFSELFCRTPPSCLKVTGGWGGVGAPFWIFGGWNWEELGWDWVWGDGVAQPASKQEKTEKLSGGCGGLQDFSPSSLWV